MLSELELSKQCITELEAENVDLRRKISEFDAERAEFKRRISEALRMTEEERTRRVAENTKLKARIEELEKNKTVTTKLESENAEFRDRITKVEQRQFKNDNSINNSLSNFNSLHSSVSEEKPLKDVKTGPAYF